MPDFLHWSAALFALIGLFLWFWSGGIPVAHRKQQIGRVAIFAAVISALLQAAGTAPTRIQLDGIVIWAYAAPSVSVSDHQQT